jgi:hypothetical protein
VRVESNHGRYGGNILDEDGVSRPGIYGIPLDGSNGTAKLTDTDAGQYDDDAALATAVYLCSGAEDLSQAAGGHGDRAGLRGGQRLSRAATSAAQ